MRAPPSSEVTFSAGAPRTQTRALRCAVEQRIARMAGANPTRRDLVQRFQELVARYNSGSLDAEQMFEDLLAFLQDLSEEDRRATRENLSEEELAIFDILTKPDVDLNADERDLVKQIARDLLGKVKHECEAIDWERNPQALASVRSTIRNILDGLPSRRYGEPLWNEKVDRMYIWIRQRYGGEATAR